MKYPCLHNAEDAADRLTTELRHLREDSPADQQFAMMLLAALWSHAYLAEKLRAEDATETVS